MRKIILIIAATAIVAGCGAFYGGLKYGQSRTSAGRDNFDFGNLTTEQRQQFATNGGTGRLNNRQNSNEMTDGEILNLDTTNLTLKLRDGGSKIVLFSNATDIGKFTSGAAADLAVGQNLTVSGKTNTDGSLTATSIQIRPDLPVAPASSTDGQTNAPNPDGGNGTNPTKPTLTEPNLDQATTNKN